MTIQSEDNLYRRGVGVMLLNAAGKVWVGARIDNSADAWQMPQGGIDEGEEPWATALRELEEETGIASAPRRADRAMPGAAALHLPPELVGVIWKEPWVGQEQDWFLCRFLGRDSDVNIATAHPEFREWKWVEPEQLPELIVPFKRDLYRRLLRDFADRF